MSLSYTRRQLYVTIERKRLGARIPRFITLRVYTGYVLYALGHTNATCSRFQFREGSGVCLMGGDEFLRPVSISHAAPGQRRLGCARSWH